MLNTVARVAETSIFPVDGLGKITGTKLVPAGITKLQPTTSPGSAFSTTVFGLEYCGILMYIKVSPVVGHGIGVFPAGEIGPSTSPRPNDELRTSSINCPIGSLVLIVTLAVVGIR